MKLFARSLLPFGSLVIAAAIGGTASADPPPNEAAPPEGAPAEGPTTGPEQAPPEQAGNACGCQQPVEANTCGGQAPAIGNLPTMRLGMMGANACPGAEQQEAAEPVGVARTVGAALEGVCLDPLHQGFVDRVLADLGTRSAALHEAKKDLLLALADALEAGTVDECTIKPKVEAFVAASGSQSPWIGADFAQLHGLLDSCQRAAFVEALGSGMSQEDKVAAAGAWIDELSKDLNLTPEQRQKVIDVFKSFEPEITAEHEAQAKAIEAFGQDFFMPMQAMPTSTIVENATARGKRMVTLTNALIEILTPEQRAQAANRLREKLAH